ncbi:bifunctional metallophosphatase/5'-nucleotidase [Parasalinivibrio latis]|uniref:bifunctional metallophosphatase/5'-nucleotidase n=1 Tax=Parasalinivibrio latis TaxID=2952610 RepID=UPI0030E2058F
MTIFEDANSPESVTSFKLTIAHLNDTHSHLESYPLCLRVQGESVPVYVNCGGFPRIANALKKTKEIAEGQGREFLFLHAGDCFQGTLYYSLFRGEADAALLNYIKPDAMTLGNHELDLGNQNFAEFMEKISFPVLAGNWDLSNEAVHRNYRLADLENLLTYNADDRCANYLLKSFGSFKVAIVGLTLEKMAEIAHPEPDTPFLPVEQVARQTLEHLKNEGVNSVILLSHLGYESDLKLAEKVPGFTAIIGGHTHTLQGDFSDLGLSVEEPYARRVGSTVIVQAGCYGMALGVLDIDFSSDGTVTSVSGGNRLLIGQRLTLETNADSSLDENAYTRIRRKIESRPDVMIVKSDPGAKAIINDRFKPAVDKWRGEVVATTDIPLRHIRIPDAQGGSQLAPLVCKAFLEGARQEGWDVDFAIHNAGGVRTSILPGKITAADIAGRLLPFTIDVMVYRVTGRQIRAALEGAINNATNNGVEGTGSGSFPYTAGLRYSYQGCNPIGDRVTKLDVFRCGKWERVDDNSLYLGASSSYTSNGKEGYLPLSQGVTAPESTGISMAESFIRWARKKGTLTPETENLVDYNPCRFEEKTA